MLGFFLLRILLLFDMILLAWIVVEVVMMGFGFVTIDSSQDGFVEVVGFVCFSRIMA